MLEHHGLELRDPGLERLSILVLSATEIEQLFPRLYPEVVHLRLEFHEALLQPLKAIDRRPLEPVEAGVRSVEPLVGRLDLLLDPLEDIHDRLRRRVVPVALGLRHRSQDSTFALLVVLVLCVLLPACSGLSGPEACNELADAVSLAISRCGGDRWLERSAFVEAVAGGDCNTIVSVRDPEALEQDCLPWLESVPCSVVNGPDFAGALPPSCRAQLEGP